MIETFRRQCASSIIIAMVVATNPTTQLAQQKEILDRSSTANRVPDSIGPLSRGEGPDTPTRSISDAIKTAKFKIREPRPLLREKLHYRAQSSSQGSSSRNSKDTAAAVLLVSGVTAAVISFAAIFPEYNKKGCEYEPTFDTPECKKLRGAGLGLSLGGIAAALAGGFMMLSGPKASKGGADPTNRYRLVSNGFSRTTNDPAFDEALRSLGDHCQGAASPSPSVLNRLSIPQRSQTSAKRPAYHPEDLAYLDDIEVAQYRPDRSQLVVIGPPAEGNGIRPDDFLTVLRAISLGEVPGVSIDPHLDPTMMHVRYFGKTENTTLGVSLFQADRLMKVMSTGFDNDDCSRWAEMPTSIIPELQLYSDEAWKESTANQGPKRWHRYWFEFNDNPLERRDDQLAVRIPRVRLRISEESVPAGQPSPPRARQFAASLTQQFEQLSRRIGVFADIQRAAGLTALAKWMVDNRVPAETGWLAAQPTPEPTADFTRRVTVTKGTVSGNRFLRVSLEGGVDFQKPNTYVQDSGSISNVLRAANAAAPTRGTRWDFNVQGRPYRAIRLSYQKPRPLTMQRTVMFTRDGGQNFPNPQMFEAVRTGSRLTIVNDTVGVLSVQVNVEGTFSISPSATGSVPLSPGSYVVSVKSACGTLTSNLVVTSGESYHTTYSCREIEQAGQTATGRLTVRNQTGSPLTIEINGPTAGRYSFQTGESSIEVPIGEYTIEVSSVCGRESDTMTIERRGKIVEYFCK